MSTQRPIRMAFDMFALAQGVQTGVYRVCDEVFPRLAARAGITPLATLHEASLKQAGRAYLHARQLDWPWIPDDRQASAKADVLLAPFFLPWEPWATDSGVVKAFIAYDLIAVLHPELFEDSLAERIREIYTMLPADTLIFSISEHTKRDLLRFRPDIPAEHVVVIPLAAGAHFAPCHDEAKLLAVRTRYAIPSQIPYLLSLATLEVRKNLHHTVKAFARYLREHPDSAAVLVLAGMHGWKLDKLHASLDELGDLRERVILTGFVPDEDLSALYSGATAFVYMSQYEGFGLPPLEAMACGTPVITSNTTSLPEVVGDAGMMLDPDDVEGLCTAFHDVLSSPERCSELRAKGCMQARHFSWEKCVDIMEAALRERLQDRPKLSIITICRNERHIEDTCRSVAEQTWKDVEWIVIDGASTDNTLHVLHAYQAHMAHLVSEPDAGRYDAMNKGLRLAKGQYVLFLNGGDTLADKQTLERIFACKPLPGLEAYTTHRFDADILYGEVLSKESGMMPWPVWSVGPQKLDKAYFAAHSLPHQATFIRRDLFRRYGLYDTGLHFAADYEWFLRVIIRHGASSAYIPMPIAVYNFEGASRAGTTDTNPHMMETHRVFSAYKNTIHHPADLLWFAQRITRRVWRVCRGLAKHAGQPACERAMSILRRIKARARRLLRTLITQWPTRR